MKLIFELLPRHYLWIIIHEYSFAVVSIAYHLHGAASTLHLHTSSAVNDLASKVRTHWAGEEDVSSSNFNRHLYNNGQSMAVDEQLYILTPGLPRGASRPRPSIAFLGLPFVAGCKGVQITPGATALTRIPLGATKHDQLRTRRTRRD